jgi:hypothetical protein
MKDDMRRTPVVMVVAGLAIGSLAGCGGGSNNAVASSTASSSTATSSASAAGETKAASADATAILQKLQSAGLPITDSIVITEDNDPNNLIGRPGQYTSKVVFADRRTGVALDKATPDNGSGGSVEVFANAAAAKSRSDYIQTSLAALGPAAGTEYDYLTGAALVRVAGALRPSEAAQYEAAVKAMG